MNFLLSISIPTYNRCKCIQNQLNNLQKGIIGFENLIEIIVNDNSSLDSTSIVVSEFIESNPGITIKYFRNSKNLGLIENYKLAILRSEATFTWILGDDDLFDPSLVSGIISELVNNGNLGFLIFNYRHIYQSFIDSDTKSEPFYTIDNMVGVKCDGKKLTDALIKNKNVWGFLWITSTVIKTRKIKDIILQNDWNDFSYPLYITLCSIKDASGIYLDGTKNQLFCYALDNSWNDNYYTLEWISLPSTFSKLVNKGYSKSLMFKQWTRCYNPQKLINKKAFNFFTNNIASIVKTNFTFFYSLIRV